MRPGAIAVVWAGLLLALASGVRAQAPGDYPARPVNVIVPFPPAGVADLIARPAMHALTEILKQPFVVNNRPGAGGATGNAAVANAKPDGYTLLFALASISAIPEAEKIGGKPPSYRLDQFAPVALLSADPSILIVRGDSPWKTIEELIKEAKTRPGKLTYSSSGVYGNIHIAVEMMGYASDARFLHVPYSGGGPANNALVGSQVDFTTSGVVSSIGFIKGGKARPLAVLGAKRLEALPEVPTLKERGLDVEYYTWTGMFAPIDTPAQILQRLREGMKLVANDAGFKAAMDKMSTPITYMDAPAFRKFWDDDAKKLADVIKRIGRLEETK